MSAILLTGDLMFLSRVEGAARTHGLSLESAANAEALLSRLAEQNRQLILVDLSAPTGDIAELVARIRAASPGGKIVAYAPHVRERLLDEAASAGCDTVLTRGQFNASCDKLLASCAQGD